MTEQKTDNVRKPIARALMEILSESTRAARLHKPYNSAHEGFAVMYEEFDELKAEVWKRHRDPVLMRAEAVQVAATALRFILDVCEPKQ